MKDLTHWKKLWCWERLKAKGEGWGRGWDDSVAPPTQSIWVWSKSGWWWRTVKPGRMQFMVLQRVRHDWVTEQKQQEERRDSDNSRETVLGIHWLFGRREERRLRTWQRGNRGRKEASSGFDGAMGPGAKRGDSFLIVKVGMKGSMWISWR